MILNKDFKMCQDLIEVCNVSKSYKTKISSSLFKPKFKEINALHDISFTYNTSGNIGVLGRNGAGKTTLLKLMTGIIHPDNGSIKILGHTPHKLDKEFKNQIGLYQGGRQQLIWDLPAIESLRLSRYIYKYSKSEFDRRIELFKEAFDIAEELNQPLRNMSLGQRTKMELLFSFLHLPKLVFLDEPSSDLDVVVRKKLREFINFCNQELKIQFVITSHNINDVFECCDKCVILDRGTVLYYDDISALLKLRNKDKITLEATTSSEAAAITKRFDGNQDGNNVEFFINKEKYTETLSFIFTNYKVTNLNVEQELLETLIANILENK